jgi:hypothetical protein
MNCPLPKIIFIADFYLLTPGKAASQTVLPAARAEHELKEEEDSQVVSGPAPLL